MRRPKPPTINVCNRCGNKYAIRHASVARIQRYCSRMCASKAVKGEVSGPRPETLAMFAKVAEVSHSIPDRHEQAAACGLNLSQLYNIRHKAKAAGYDIAPIKNVGQFLTRYTDKFAKIEAEMEGPGCPVCGLHGSHACTKNGLIALVQSRMSMWVEPATDAEDAA